MGDPPGEVVPALTTEAVLRMVGIKPSTLEYWIRKGLVEPTVRGSSGPRVSRLWTVQEAVLVRSIASLRAAGCSLQRITRARDLIEDQWREAFKSSVLVWNGADLFSIGQWGEVRSAWRRPGQLALVAVALPLGQWRLDAEAEAVAFPGRLTSDAAPRSSAV